MRQAHGFTLIEVLIALAIVAIAVTAVIKATSQNIRSTGYLQQKTIAMWIGQDVIHKAQVQLVNLSDDSGDQKDSTTMLNQTFYWQGSEQQTPNKNIYKLIVKVFPTQDDESPLVTLTGYRYNDQN
jgi:general secretion pathway protein I